MRSIIIVLEEASRPEVARFLDKMMTVRSDSEWSFDDSIVISFYDDAEVEFEAEALVALHDRLAGRSSVSLIGHVSGRIPGDTEVRRFCRAVLSQLRGFVLDDYTYHFWSLEEIEREAVQEKHRFFDYDGWYKETTGRQKGENAEAYSRKKWSYVTVLLLVPALYCIYFFRFENAYINKTGIGPIGRDYYVFLDEDPNTLLLPGNKNWIGKSRNLNETVIISDDGVIPFSWKLAFRAHSVVVCFRPDRVYLCECSRFRRGYYLRMKMKSENRSNQTQHPTTQ